MAAPVQASRPASPLTLAANAFVAGHSGAAQRLGTEIGDLVDDPEAFVRALRKGLKSLIDQSDRREQSRVAWRPRFALGIRLPLLGAVRQAFNRASQWAGPDSLLWLAERLLREEGLEIRVLAFEILGRVLPQDPERGWQVLRRAARDAQGRITVDALAHTYALGILLEPFRWSEIEQLVYSPSRWERTLIGSTIATIPFLKPDEGQRAEIARRAFAIVGNLIGDADPDVQKALSWALRSMAHVDRAALTRFAQEQSIRAWQTDDGHRARVIRDALPALADADAARIRKRLAGIRRRPGAAATSEAAEMAQRFRGLVEETPRVAGRRAADLQMTAVPAASARDQRASGVTA